MMSKFCQLNRAPGLCAVVGHEISGVVSRVGSNVKDIDVGDHVGIGYYIDSCLDCEYCEKGRDVQDYMRVSPVMLPLVYTKCINRSSFLESFFICSASCLAELKL